MQLAAACFAAAVSACSSSTLSSNGRTSLWQSPSAAERWYDHGRAYWKSAAATNDGVMSNIGELHDTDIADSVRFLTAGENPLWPQPTFREKARALDIGAGIGRVSGSLLLNLCGEVDLVDGSAAFLERARATLADEPQVLDAARGRAGSFFCSELQQFVPTPSYDLIWIQWTTMYLTDEDLRRLLGDCQRSLARDGLIVLKDNVIDVVKGSKGLVDGRFLVDEEDASVSRTRAHLLDVVHEAGLSVVASSTANLESDALSTCLNANGWDEMHPVINLALR